MAKRKYLKIGIATRAESIERTTAIVSGKRRRKPDDPDIWITPQTARKLLDQYRCERSDG